MNEIIALRRTQNELLAEARGIHELAKKENRDLNETEAAKFAELTAKVEQAQRTIEREERMALFGAAGKADSNIGMSKNEVGNYSLVRALNAMVTRDWSKAGLEKEASEAVAKRIGRQPNGLYIPLDVQVRDLDLTNGAGAISTNTSTSMIDLLRNKMVLRQAGATFLNDLSGVVQFPKQTGAGSFYWVGEGDAPTESQQTVAQVVLSPKTIGAYTEVTRQLLAQSSLDVEMLVRNDLMTVLALGLDYTALHGDDTVATAGPDGIENITGVGAPTFTASWSGVVALESAVAAANADVGRLGYITNAKMRGMLKSTAKVASSDSVMVWADGQYPLNGYAAYVSNAVRANAGAAEDESYLFFGNWADLLIGTWGAMDVLADPYSVGTTGKTRIIVFQEADVAVKHAASFAYGTAKTA